MTPAPHATVTDPDRLAALDGTGLMDSPPEEGFDRLTRLVARSLAVPVALVSLVDRDRQFFKSCVGLPEPWASARETPLTHSFCQHVAGMGSALVVEDALTHPLVRDNLAVKDLGVRAYLGVPLTGPEGHVLGSLCAVDSRVRRWKPEDVESMEEIAKAVMAEIERRESREGPRSEEAPGARALEPPAPAVPHAAEPARRPDGRRARGSITARMTGYSITLAVLVGSIFVVLSVAISDLQASADGSAASQDNVTGITRLGLMTVEAQTATRGFLISRDERFLAPLKRARSEFAAEARQLLELTRQEGESVEEPERLVKQIRDYIEGYAVPLVALTRTDPDRARRSVARGEGKRRVDRIRREVARLVAQERRDVAARRMATDRSARRAVAVATGGLVLSVLMLLGFAVYLTRSLTIPVRGAAEAAKRLARGDLSARAPEKGAGEVRELGSAFNTMAGSIESGRAELQRQFGELEGQRHHRDRQVEFTETLQVTRSEREAHDVLRRHLERTLPSSVAVVLNRNADDERIEASTAVPAGSGLAQTLDSGRAPLESCLAARLAKTHSRSPGAEPLLTCDLCGATGSSTTCSPVLVGGQVFGSVLVLHGEALEQAQQDLMSDSVNQAAPVLANLRNLARAEQRALTDAVTGLPNRRAAEQQVERLLAAARRSEEPVGVVMADLDCFKNLNDRYGHDRGDDVLVAAAEVFRRTLRQSDFASRYGGEEFLFLLPDTDAAGAAAAAAKLRTAVARLAVPGVEEGITCSFGVAAFPRHGRDADEVVRRADEALYAAKAAGRDRVEQTGTSRSLRPAATVMAMALSLRPSACRPAPRERPRARRRRRSRAGAAAGDRRTGRPRGPRPPRR